MRLKNITRIKITTSFLKQLQNFSKPSRKTNADSGSENQERKKPSTITALTNNKPV